MSWIHVVILALVQGMAELLPVSSSAHVIVAATLLGENMSTPANALLLVLLHTGTMFAVIAYFWRRWMDDFFSSWSRFQRLVQLTFVSCLLTGVVGYPIIEVIQHWLGQNGSPAAIEELFNRLNWIAPALAAVGILIIVAGLREARRPKGAQGSTVSTGSGAAAGAAPNTGIESLSWPAVLWMGVLQGLALPFRGFSRSGATISGGLLTGGRRQEIESFSFLLAVAITPLAIARELYRVVKNAHAAAIPVPFAAVLTPGAIGMVCAFLAGLLALRWLSSWLENGRWHWFGVYCLAAAAVVQVLYLRGW